MFRKRIFPFVVLFLLLTGCGTSPTSTPTISETQPAEPPPPSAETPLEWLGNLAFLPAPQGQPTITPSSLPEGFNSFDPEHAESTLPSGGAIHVSEQDFERPVDNQVYVEDSVTVTLYAYAQAGGRAEHLGIIAEQDYTWAFYELEGHRIARYSNSGVDGRVWISGPYLIVIYSGLDVSETSPWVDTFAGLYLEMFPPE